METLKPLLTLAAALLFALSPLLSQGFNGFEAGQFPIPQEDPPVQPAGYAFAIWGLIYLWLIAGAGFGLLRRAADPDWAAMRAPLTLSLLIGAAWIPVANLSPGWATAMIWAMWATAALAHLRAGSSDRIWQRTPVALYAGWLTAASCVASGLMLAGHGILSAQAAAILMILVALVLAAILLRLRADTPEYALAVIWALAGIVVANAAPANPAVLGLAAAGILALAVMALRPGARG